MRQARYHRDIDVYLRRGAYLDDMQILGAVGRYALGGDELGQIERAFPRLETPLVEVGLDVALFQTRDEFFVLVVGCVFGHELGADIKHLSPGECERSICPRYLDGEFVVGDL